MERLSDQDINRVLSGSVDPADPKLGTLSAFAQTMRETFARGPSEQLAERHLRAMAEAFEPGPAVRRVRRRRRAVVTAVAAMSVLGASAALAATGNLGPLQDGAASVANTVGLEIPDGDDQLPPGHAEDKATERAQTNRETAKSFVDAKTEWTSCVAEKAPAHEGEEGFDPEEACGPKPDVKDFKPERTANPNAGGDGQTDGAQTPASPGDGVTGGDNGQGKGKPAENPGQGHGQAPDAPAE